ncbi:cytochrome ubiquinol oxidase subunit II [Paenibacillus pectinilyticus]|uniref:Quinol oxidase subunit 2 n=1 Tax=Paenibacillus pectinilyticus TaxID=512399 RepID=A0A1C1A1M7_9BACL|nr:ubiquinol oxidase subunit II [Paenibacillus pectinilyticus]OCT14423.1 cytochrome ubiquinol oxidase subunit II [Paenibacillus pectinilyticus]
MKKRKLVQAGMLFTMVAIITLLSGCGHQAMVLDPKGPVGAQQRDLIVIATILCAIILVPVLALTAWIVWRYRDKKGNKASYKPNWSHSTSLEVVWWAVPIIIIVALAVVTVKYTYALNPSKPLKSDKEAITIQVTSLDWKWLFTYPEQGIATVNYLQIPEDTPIKFELTSDAPMNSFWIPQLGGQIYTMSGMKMTLYLQADEIGHYFGTGANFSGEHFADMTFDVNTTSRADFDTFVAKTKNVPTKLTDETYKELSMPGKSGVRYFSSIPDDLFDRTVMKYMHGATVTNGIEPGHKSMGSKEEGTIKADTIEKNKPMDHSKMDMDHSQMNMSK